MLMETEAVMKKEKKRKGKEENKKNVGKKNNVYPSFHQKYSV